MYIRKRDDVLNIIADTVYAAMTVIKTNKQLMIVLNNLSLFS